MTNRQQPQGSDISEPPIATSYEHLQSLPRVSEAFSCIPTTLDSSDRVIYLNTFCLALICENLVLLFDNCLAELEKSDHSVAHVSQRGIWARDILYLANTIARHATNSRDEQASGTASTERLELEIRFPSLKAMLDKKEILDAQLTPLFSSNKNIRRIVHSHNQLDPHLNIIQNWKICNTLICTLCAQMTEIPSRDETVMNRIQGVAKQCFSSLSIERDSTLFQQFRLMHQIPEFLGLEVIRLTHEFPNKIEGRETYWLLDCLETISRHLAIFVDATVPLANEMTPTEYHEIRRRLGKTSGSQSQSLAHFIFSQPFRKVLSASKRYIDSLPSRSPAQRYVKRRFRFLITDVTELVSLWRDYHMMFPRNVLGGSGVVSLIGAKDAVEVVGVHASSAAAKLMESTHLGRMSAFDIECKMGIPSASSALDRLLLDIVGECTKNTFPDVQDRRGNYE